MRFVPWCIILPGDFHGNLQSLNLELRVLLRCGLWFDFSNVLKISFLFQLFGQTLGEVLNLIGGIVRCGLDLVCIEMPLV